MKVFDFTIEDRGEDRLCPCRGAECKRISNHVACWMMNPTAGICPFMKGNEHDNRKSTN